jgi:hypothetical protein
MTVKLRPDPPSLLAQEGKKLPTATYNTVGFNWYLLLDKIMLWGASDIIHSA